MSDANPSGSPHGRSRSHLQGGSHEIPISGRHRRRRRGRRVGALPPRQARLDGRGAGRALGADGGLVVARGGRGARPQRGPEHGRAAGVHHRPAVRDREGIRPEHRSAHDRRDHCRFGTGALGVAAVGVPDLPDHRDRGLPPDDPGRDPREVPHHGRHRGHRRTVGGPRGLPRYHRHRPRVRRRRPQAGRRGHRAQQGRGTEPARRRHLGCGDRERRHPRRARRQRGRAVGQAGRAHGGARPPALAAAAPLLRHRVHSRGGGDGLRGADDGGPRRLHLYPPGPAGRARRDLRGRSQALEYRRRALGLRLRSHPRGDRSDRRRAGDGMAPVPGAAACGGEAVGERRLHLLPGRQPAGGTGAGDAQLLARLRSDGRISPGRRSRKISRGMDDRRGGGGRRVADGHRTLRTLRLEPGVHQADHRAVLLASLRDDLSERTASRRKAASQVSGPRRHERRGLPLGMHLGPGDAADVRAARLRGDTDTQALERVPDRGRGVRGGTQAGGSRRHLGILALRGERLGREGVARSDHGLAPSRSRPRQARANARSERTAQG